MRRPRRSLLRRLRIGLIPLPGQAIGLAVLVAVLAAALVSAPLMEASAEQGAWTQERARLSETVVGTTWNSSSLAGRQVSGPNRITRAAELDDAMTADAARVGLEPVFFSRLRDPLLSPLDPDGHQLVFRAGAEDHVDILAGAPSDDGVLIPQSIATEGGLGPGDTISMTDDDGVPISFRISGVYADPTAPLPPYWDGFNFLWLPVPDLITGELVYPPTVLLAPRDIALGGADQLGEDVFLEWFFPLEEGIGVAEAREAIDRTEQLQAITGTPESGVTRLVTEEGFPRPSPRSSLPVVLGNVDTTVGLLSPPVRAVGVGGGLAALVLIGAWSGQRMRRREDELRSLVARGLSPARGAGDAARESLVPVLLGVAAGGAAGWLLVRQFGPSPDFPPGTLLRSLIALGAGAVAALLVIAAVTAVLVGRLDSIGRGQAAHALRKVPWLAITAAITVVLLVPLVTGSAEGGRIGVDTLLVPLLVTVVVAGAVTAALPRIGRSADTRLRRMPVGGFLAARRVLAASGGSRLVVMTTALSLGLVVFAGALADSTSRTIDVKASVASGSDVVVTLQRGSTADGELPSGTMAVGLQRGVHVIPGDTSVAVLAVHPEQVAGIVRWNDALADQSLDQLMAALRDYDGDRVPVILAGPLDDAVLEGTGGALTVDFDYYTLPVQVVGRAEAFPGQGSRDPMLVADWDSYADALRASNRDPGLVIQREVWARGDVEPALQRLAAAGYAPAALNGVHSSSDFAARPEINAQTWSLSYLRAIALAAGVLGLVGVAMHAVALQRRRTAATLLLRRMGMSRTAAQRSSGLEIGLLTGLAALVAVAVALPTSALVLRLLDPLPTLRPSAVFAVPWGSLALLVAGVVLVTLAASMLVGRAARRATGGQVMRDAA